MRRLPRRVAAACATALAAAAVTVGAPAQAAQASTTTHCPTSLSLALLPSGSGYFFPTLFVSRSACGFVDGGPLSSFPADRAPSNVSGLSGPPRPYVVDNLSVVCSAVTVDGDSVRASGCGPA
ncbi:hypothetical protein [Streptomyces galbus]|uniref:Secreted protein n=1 Tax=Streptomyces galbus TaxID=33898 RepID=A0ABX1IVL1_STRGB|nr:hypothetical protein [Streptomyces galbus]NKQ28316.1 hypothetical protein [Streptomyces galbus]